MAKIKKIDSDKPEKVVKKKKVGRPKKRGRKKKYYQPKKKLKKFANKGFSKNITYNRVRAVLWGNFKDDFPSYRAFISNQKDEDGNPIKGTSVVSQVFAQCKDLDCLDSDIIEIYNQFKNQLPNEEDKPVLPNNYYDAHYYWEILTEDWWSGFDSRVWVVSPMLLIDPDNFLGILGSDRYVDKDGELINRKFDSKKGDYIISGKAQRFNEFVNYCNTLQTEGYLTTSDDVPHWRFTGESEEMDDAEVYWNPFTKRWEVKIVICEPTGDVQSYDFDPSEPDAELDKDLINSIISKPKTKPSEPTIQDIPEEPKGKISTEEIKIKEKELEQEDRRLKLEEEKSNRKNKLLERYLDGKINEDTFLEMLKLI